MTRLKRKSFPVSKKSVDSNYHTMKKNLILLILLVPAAVFCQEKKETINREFPVTPGRPYTLWIDNINGSVSVTGYSGPSITIEAVKWVKSSSNDELQNSWQQLQLKFEQYNDTVAAYPDGICDCDCDSHHHRKGWNNCHFKDDYSIDFTVQVPILQKPDCLETTLLQRHEIAFHSSRISHTGLNT